MRILPRVQVRSSDVDSTGALPALCSAFLQVCPLFTLQSSAFLGKLPCRSPRQYVLLAVPLRIEICEILNSLRRGPMVRFCLFRSAADDIRNRGQG